MNRPRACRGVLRGSPIKTGTARARSGSSRVRRRQKAPKGSGSFRGVSGKAPEGSKRLQELPGRLRKSVRRLQKAPGAPRTSPERRQKVPKGSGRLQKGARKHQKAPGAPGTFPACARRFQKALKISRKAAEGSQIIREFLQGTGRPQKLFHCCPQVARCKRLRGSGSRPSLTLCANSTPASQ